MGIEEVTSYRAYCDFGDNSPENREYCGEVFEGDFGESLSDSDFQLGRDLLAAGWIVDLDDSGWPARYASFRCPEHKEKP